MCDIMYTRNASVKHLIISHRFVIKRGISETSSRIIILNMPSKTF